MTSEYSESGGSDSTLEQNTKALSDSTKNSEFDKKRRDSKHVKALSPEDLKTKDVEDLYQDVLNPREKWRIMKNVVVLSLAFMVHFTAFQGAANLQSSINADAGLGTASLASIYASLILSNLFLPVVMINWLGCKWTNAVSFVAYMPYIAAQFYPRFYTMIPAGIFVGLGGGPLWCAKCTYLTVVSVAYEKISGIPAEVLVVRFFGIFFMIFQFAQVWGNLISSLVLSDGSSEPSTVNPEICGANFLASTSGDDALQSQPIEKIQMIAGIYLACMVGAVIIVAVGVDPLTRYDKNRQGSGSGLSGPELLAITMKLLKEKNQILLLTITAWLGLGQAFLGADYTAAYVACAWGTSNIGYVMICYGLCNSISAIATGSLVKLTGRLPVVLSAMILQIGLIISLLVWQPRSDHIPIFFVISGLWGVCDGVWLVQINALCGILFPAREEAAYSNFRLWESLGFIIAYVYSPYLRTYVKLYILLAVLIVGMAGYVVIEVTEMKKWRLMKRTKEDAQKDTMARTNDGFDKQE